MDASLKNNRLISEQEESENTPESGPDSPPSSLFNDTKVAATSSPKRSKRGGSQKRVAVSVPIKDVGGSRLRGEKATPPSDSWAWRKYGQKPIKGSPYPRGYYRCSSSSKGCPARKQVERSTVDPATLLVTYSREHNHPWPLPSRTNRRRHNNPSSSSSSSSSSSASASFTAKPHPATDTDAIKPESPGPRPENHFAAADIAGDEPLVTIEEFAWFGHVDHQTWTSSTILDGPILAEELRSADVGLFPMMREEDELLFADLGELPECSSVFMRHRGVGPQVQIC